MWGPFTTEALQRALNADTYYDRAQPVSPRQIGGGFVMPWEATTMYDGPTPTKFGRYHIADPFRVERMHLDDRTNLKVVDHEPPLPVLDQEDLIAQGIDTAKVIPGLGRSTRSDPAPATGHGPRWRNGSQLSMAALR